MIESYTIPHQLYAVVADCINAIVEHLVCLRSICMQISVVCIFTVPEILGGGVTKCENTLHDLDHAPFWPFFFHFFAFNIPACKI